MKKLFVFLAFLSLVIACKKASKTYSYETINTVYQSLPDVGFESNRYEIANYVGKERQALPFSKKYITLFRETAAEHSTSSGFLELFQGLHTGTESFCFLSDFKEIPLLNLYFDGQPFTRSDTENAEPGRAHLWLQAVDLDGNSFLIKGKPYDFHAEQAGAFMNGQIIFDYLPIDGDIPLAACNLKVWGKKIIFQISQSLSYGKKAYVIFNPETKELVCTDIKNGEDK